MTKRNSTKRALLMSVLSLLLCFSMLVGTTLAWFTDSVTSAGNVIATGDLKVDLEVLSETTGEWTSVKESQAPIFSYENWEPGYVQVKVLRVVNEGSLALKWKARLTSESELSILADVIDVYVKEGVEAYPTRADVEAWTCVGTLAEFVNNIETTTTGEIEAKAAVATEYPYEALGIAFKMREDAGNEYQDKTLGKFTLQILATQNTVESDSFDEKYDADAEFDGEISSADSLVAALKNGGTYKVKSDIEFDGAGTIPAGVTVNLDLDGKTITSTVGRDADNNRVHTLVNNGTLTLKNGTVSSSGTNGGAAILNNGTLVVDNATLNGAPQEGSGIWPSYVVNNYGVMTISNSTVTGAQGVISTNTATAETIVNNVIATRNGWGGSGHVFYTPAGKLTVNGGTYTNNANGVDGMIFASGSGVTTYVNGGTFDINDGAYFALSNGTNLIVTGGDFSDIKSVHNWGGSMTVSGGTFGFDPSAYVADGCMALNNFDGTYTVYGVDSANTTITVNDATGLVNLTKLNNNWAALFSNGQGSGYGNYAAANGGKGAEYYYKWNWTIKLNADADLNGASIDPINLSIWGAFDGQDHTIKNAVIVTDNATENEAGLFAAGNCDLKNIKLDNISVTGSNVGNSTAGILSGSCNGAIDNIEISNSSVVGGKYTGGVVGYGYTDITNCTLTNVTVKGGYKLGGLIGYICASSGTGDVTGNALTDCTVKGNDGIYAGGKNTYIVGKLVGNYNCNGTCNNNTITNMTTTATANIGEIEANKVVNQ